MPGGERSVFNTLGSPSLHIRTTIDLFATCLSERCHFVRYLRYFEVDFSGTNLPFRSTCVGPALDFMLKE
jgi:hypothetical protein